MRNMASARDCLWSAWAMWKRQVEIELQVYDAFGLLARVDTQLNVARRYKGNSIYHTNNPSNRHQTQPEPCGMPDKCGGAINDVIGTCQLLRPVLAFAECCVRLTLECIIALSSVINHPTSIYSFIPPCKQ